MDFLCRENRITLWGNNNLHTCISTCHMWLWWVNPRCLLCFTVLWLLYWGTEIPLNGYVHYIALFEKANMEYWILLQLKKLTMDFLCRENRITLWLWGKITSMHVYPHHMPRVIMMSQSTILAMFYSSDYHCNWQLLVICRSTCVHECAIARNEKDIAATCYAYSTMHAIS